MRARFEPPVGDLTMPAFVGLYIRAAITDSGDREPVPGDYAYWREKMPELVARGQVNGIGDRYPWLKLIGWQATGADVPPYGPYAVPPNGGPPMWRTQFVDVGTTDHPDEPVPVVSPTITETLGRLEQRVVALATQGQALATQGQALASQIDANTEKIQQQIDQAIKNMEKSAAALLPLLKRP